MLFCKQCCSFKTGLSKKNFPQVFSLYFSFEWTRMKFFYPILSLLNRFWYIPWYQKEFLHGKCMVFVWKLSLLHNEPRSCKGEGIQWVLKNGELHLSSRFIGLFYTEKIQFLIEFYRVAQKHTEKTRLSTWFFYYELYQFLLWQLTLNVKTAFCKTDSYLEGYSATVCVQSCSSQDSRWQMIMKLKDRVLVHKNQGWRWSAIFTASQGAWRYSAWPLAAAMKVVSLLQRIMWFTSGNC